MEYGAIGIWLAVVGGLWLAGLPLAAVLFDRFPDRGAAFGLPVALAVLGIVVSLVGRVSMLAGIAAGVLALLIGVVLAARRGVSLSPRALVGPVIVFGLAFGLLIVIRGFDPAVHPGGGEKFLDFGLLKSVLRADQLPPEDVWFAGEPVSYYYGGHLLAGVLTRLSGLDPRFTYNLALATFYAALVTTAYGLAGAIADRHGATRIGAGVFAAVLVGVASNLEPAGEAVLWALPDSPSRTITDGLGIERMGLIESPADFGYWGASRVIDGTVNEFPLFAWLNGDLHAHMMSTPFLLLAAAICFAYFLTPGEDVWRRRGLVFGALPAITGLLALVNTWSFPTPVGLAWLTLTFADAEPATLLGDRVGSRLRARGGWLRREASRAIVALVLAAGVLGLALCWSLPFWLGPASGQSVEFLPDRSPLGPLLLVHGGFLAVFVPYLLSRRRSRGLSRAESVLAVLVAIVATVAWLAIVGIVLDLAGVAVFAPLLVGAWVVLRRRERPGGWSFGHASSTDPSSERDGERRVASNGAGDRMDGQRQHSDEREGNRNTVGFETVLLIAGVGLALLVEFVYVSEQAAGGRFNTVFKLYAQVWVLFAVAAGAMAGLLLTHTKPVSMWRRASLPHVTGALTSGRYVGTRLLLAGVVVSTAIYGGLALSEHVTEDHRYKPDDPSLDALAFVGAAHPEEADAIAWLDNRTDQPTMVSAPGDGRRTYQWYNAPSSLTGVPTLAGWGHETGYRANEAYYERVGDVETIFNGTPDQQRQLLATYDVQYIYVGPEERDRYRDGEFDALAGVTVERRWEAVTIYAVDRSELSA